MRSKAGLLVCLTLLLAFTGCHPGGMFIRPDQQRTIDRAIVDYPPSFDLKEFAQNLNCPTAMCFDPDGTMFIVEGGIANQPVHIFGRRADGSQIEIYPLSTRLPLIARDKFKVCGPVGGIAASNGKLFVTHRDANDMGVVTAFNYDGTHSSVTSEFPAQGDYGITDITVRPGDGRLFFGVGPATNSGVVGPDNIAWLRKHANAFDVSPFDLKLYGLKFTSPNPLGGWFGAPDRAVTGPFQQFNTNDKTRIKKAENGRANSCVYSISQSGGDLRMESCGIRLPRGLGFSEYGCYATNDGMEMRGTRPVKDDPDAFIKVLQDGSWYGFPDYSTNMIAISDQLFQPPAALLKDSGYPDINQLIDRDNSNLPRKLMEPNRNVLSQGIFPSMSGASKFDFIPENTTALPYRNFKGHAIVALSGDRAPYATSGQPLPNGPVGYKIVSVNLDNKKVTDFIYNTRGLPASKMGKGVVGLDCPCDVKMGPDGSLYILDMGVVSMKTGQPHIAARTGRIFKLIPIV